MKSYVAQSSELSGPLNPRRIWSAKYLSLVSALNRDDHPDNVKQALFDWLGERNFSQAQVVGLLNEEPDVALDTVIKKLGAGLARESLPQQFVDTLRRTLAYIAKDTRQQRGHEIGKEIAGLRKMKRRYRAEALAANLIS